MIISGGVNIYPIEIEACLLKLTGVADCAVFGIPDDEYGESIAAAIKLDEGVTLSADDIRAHVREHLAGFKVPRSSRFTKRCRERIRARCSSASSASPTGKTLVRSI